MNEATNFTDTTGSFYPIPPWKPMPCPTCNPCCPTCGRPWYGACPPYSPIQPFWYWTNTSGTVHYGGKL